MARTELPCLVEKKYTVTSLFNKDDVQSSLLGVHAGLYCTIAVLSSRTVRVLYYLGSVDEGYFPGLTETLYCRVCWVHGQDWSVTAGQEEGLSQVQFKYSCVIIPHRFLLLVCQKTAENYVTGYMKFLYISVFNTK